MCGELNLKADITCTPGIETGDTRDQARPGPQPHAVAEAPHGAALKELIRRDDPTVLACAGTRRGSAGDLSPDRLESGIGATIDRHC
jgi:hypothetical protein